MEQSATAQPEPIANGSLAMPAIIQTASLPDATMVLASAGSDAIATLQTGQDERDEIHPLIRGGGNIFPRGIKDFLYTDPAIEQVEVIGGPDEASGEDVCTWIKLSDANDLIADEARAVCKRQIVHLKIPGYIGKSMSFR